MRIDSSERVELNGDRGGRMSNKRKSKKHASTPRRREVLLSKISIYIVYMFVSCHRYVNLENHPKNFTMLPKKLYYFILFENYSKCCAFEFSNLGIFHHFCLVTLFDSKLQVFKNSPKWTIFGIFN